ncbi:MAG: FAD-dependent 5-carboxymethylaminomethyl-2-thiouridine(34) oxidoreductase MnmC [Alphaproteobacteria bacterium]|nr:FAD-dependent 5-carboxymethylaminomethyl-2-thiouridine(34) oxidoreductase MnmC [Alphaproteobacteria bacterium]MBU2380861.1 FAD-dependent 5-carboxymethylaminomethyl-2-thiouridine(34) oxidoreductase MnmC [Alphaproteobacteria bacterium]
MTDADDRNPRLVWTNAGEPRSGRFDDVYFSAEDGLAETRTVFLSGCGMPEAWRDRRHFTVAELGFGSGLNIAALLDLWRRTRPAGGRLNIFSIEGYPLDRDEARRALSAWPELHAASEAMLAAWPPNTPGFHRVDLPDFHAVLDIAVGEAAWALQQWSGRADAWFLDGFAPSVNPDMWSDDVLDRIAERSAPDARLATFTVAGAVRRGLSERGFEVAKRPGHGRKRERLEARRSDPARLPPSPPSVIVIGAGVAGASVARGLAAQGCEVVLIEAEGHGAGASGFPAALVTARFDLGDATVAALFSQSLERAGALYRDIPGAILARGVMQLVGTEREAARFGRIVDQPIWPPDAMKLLDVGQATAALAEPVEGPALTMASALTVAPAVILSALLDGVTIRPGRAARIEAAPGGWRVVDADGLRLAEAANIVVCAGAETTGLLPEIPTSPVRGQAEWVEGPPPPAVAWGGYVAPTADGMLFGATHDRSDVGRDVRAQDTARNLATLEARLPELAGRIDSAAIRSRAAVRATTRDRLPIAGAVPGRPGLFVLGGLGSRGFCLAPLLGEHLAALVLDRPSPLPADISARISPSRAALAPLAQPRAGADA